MNYTKEQAKQVLTDWFNFKDQRATTTKTYETFLSHMFPSLEVGKWVTNDNFPNHIGFITEIDGDKYYYYGFNCFGDWKNNDYYYFDHLSRPRPATNKEVTKALITEAERRGFCYGAEYLDVKGKKNYRCEEDFRLINNRLMCTDGGGWIFEDGEWAEIVDSTKDNIIKTVKKSKFLI